MKQDFFSRSLFRFKPDLFAKLAFCALLLLGTAHRLTAQCTYVDGSIQMNQHYTTFAFYVSTTGEDDLGVNPLASVDLSFFHSFSSDALIALESPSGLIYTLVGDEDNSEGSACTNGFPIGFDGRIVRGNNKPAFTPVLNQNQEDWTVYCTPDPALGLNFVLGSQNAPTCDLNDFNVPGHPITGVWKLHLGCVCAVGLEQFVLTRFGLNFEIQTDIICNPSTTDLRVGEITRDTYAFEVCDQLDQLADSLVTFKTVVSAGDTVVDWSSLHVFVNEFGYILRVFTDDEVVVPFSHHDATLYSYRLKSLAGYRVSDLISNARLLTGQRWNENDFQQLLDEGIWVRFEGQPVQLAYQQGISPAYLTRIIARDETIEISPGWSTGYSREVQQKAIARAGSCDSLLILQTKSTSRISDSTARLVAFDTMSFQIAPSRSVGSNPYEHQEYFSPTSAEACQYWFEDDKLYVVIKETGTYNLRFETSTSQRNSANNGSSIWSSLVRLDLDVFDVETNPNDTLQTVGNNESTNLSKNRMHIYPNPSEGLFNIKTSEFPVDVSVYDSQGRLLKSFTTHSKFTQQQLDFPPGLYNVVARFEEDLRSVSQRWLVKR